VKIIPVENSKFGRLSGGVKFGGLPISKILAGLEFYPKTFLDELHFEY